MSTGFHDVIYIVLLLCHLSYLFATSPFSFINGFNKASVTFISQVWCPKRGNRNMHKNKHEVRAKNSWIPLPCNVCNSAFGIYIYGDLDTSCPKKNIIILVISMEIYLSCMSYQKKRYLRNIILIILGKLKTNIINIRLKYILPQVLLVINKKCHKND